MSQFNQGVSVQKEIFYLTKSIALLLHPAIHFYVFLNLKQNNFTCLEGYANLYNLLLSYDNNMKKLKMLIEY